MSSYLRLTAIAFLALILCLPSIAWSGQNEDIELIQRNGPRVASIVTQVAVPGGKVDKAVHDEFWDLLPKSVQANPKSFVANLAVVKSMTYQKELWESIRLSARSGKVTKTLSYQTALLNALGNDAAGQDAARRADRMLAAAAAGQPFQGSKGTQVLSEEMANQVLDGLNASTARLQQLLNPVWRGS
jgi:hypothetical protein